MSELKLPDFIRRRIEQAIQASANPAGMGIHDGTVRVHGADLAYMLKLIDKLEGIGESHREPQHRTVKIEDCELIEFDGDQPDGEFYLVPKEPRA